MDIIKSLAVYLQDGIEAFAVICDEDTLYWDTVLHEDLENGDSYGEEGTPALWNTEDLDRMRETIFMRLVGLGLTPEPNDHHYRLSKKDLRVMESTPMLQAIGVFMDAVGWGWDCCSEEKSFVLHSERFMPFTATQMKRLSQIGLHLEVRSEFPLSSTTLIMMNAFRVPRTRVQSGSFKLTLALM